MLEILAQSLMIATRFHEGDGGKPLNSYESRQEMLLHDRRLQDARNRAARVLQAG